MATQQCVAIFFRPNSVANIKYPIPNTLDAEVAHRHAMP